ncbi:MAG: hypothetical protein GQ538_11180 [Xanthomonadales bacterium]|nr:hypothetical protein [Xanthomonadales bacterium]
MNEQNHIDQRTQDLLNGGIDGELSSSEQSELDRLLAGSDNLLDLNNDLKSLTGLLDSLPEVDPPQYLQEAIERQVRLPVQSDRHEEKNGFFGTWLPVHWLRTGFALAAGAVLTVSVYEMGSKPMSPDDVSNLSGTIVNRPVASQGELLDSIQIVTDTLIGSVEIRSKDDMFTLDVQLNSDGPTQLVVDFSGRGLEFEAVTHVQDRQDAVSIVDGSVKIATNGEQRYTMSLRQNNAYQGQTTAPLELDFFANQLLVHEAELSVSQQNQ